MIAVVVLTLPAAAAIAGAHSAAPSNADDRSNFTSEVKAKAVSQRPENDATGNVKNAGASTVAGLSLVVNTLSDAADSNIGDSHCDTDTNLVNGDQCSLRAAIQEANSAATDDVITFAPSLNGGTITLTSGLDLISGNLVLNGPGASQLNVQRSTAAGTPSFRILGISNSAVVMISGLTISNGNAPSGDNGGGGIYNSGTLTMTNCNVFGNSTGGLGGGSGAGGGIFNTFVLTLNHCNIGGTQPGQGNTANDGGGINNLGSSFFMTGGSVVGNNGSGITLAFGANATLNGVDISGNTGGVTGGGGVVVGPPSTASIQGCLISGNLGISGGGIYNGGSVNVGNSTISGNTSSASGGGIANLGNFLNPNPPITLTNTTITSNRSDSDNAGGEQGGGVFRDSGTVTLNNTIIAGNFRGGSPATTADDIFGTVASTSAFNLIGTGGAGGLTNGTSNNQVGVANPVLGPLADNGGATQTHALLPGSPAIDAGNGTLSTDQRGQPRPIDDQTVPNAPGSNAGDIGAYEAHTFQVNSIADANDGACTTLATGNGCTLREAIIAANAENGAELILFAPALIGSGPATITLLNALPDLSSDMMVTGPVAHLVTVQRSTAVGTPGFRIFTVQSGRSVNLSGLTISGGNPTSGNNGGGISNSGALTLTASTISGNAATGGGGSGGGICNLGSLTLINSTVSGNSADFGFGGGIENDSSMVVMLINSTVRGNRAHIGGGINQNGTLLTLTNSTVSSNNVSSSGNAAGGIFVSGPSTLTLTNSTVCNNTVSDSGSGGGIFNNGSTVNLKNTIIASNTVNGGGGPDLVGTFNSQDYNLIGSTSGASFTGTTAHDITNVDARLGPLADNGGPTQTHALLAGSPALDAGDDLITGPPLRLLTDQRGAGFARRVDGPDSDQTARVDIGAFEAQVSLEDIADRTTNEDTQLQFSFNLGGSGSITSVTATSANTTLVPNSPVNIALTGSGSTRTLTVNPVSDQFGVSTITVTVTGNNSQSMADTFDLTIAPVNDAPSFTKGPDQTVNNNAGLQTIENWATGLSAGPANESSQILTFLVSNDNPGLFATAPTVNSTDTLTYAPATNAGGTATITVVLQDNGGTANGGNNMSAPETFTINVNPVGGFLKFSAANSTITESSGFATITVTRTGDKSLPVTVDYATSGDSGVPCSTINGLASPRCDFTAAFGSLRFAVGEDTKTLTVLITQDSYTEGPENLTLTLSNATGFAALATPSAASLTITDDATEPATSPIDEADDFVRQHYYDFLSRIPDSGGLTFWIGQITQCGNDQMCLRGKRIDVSNAFFYELEYQQTGSYVYRVYRAAFGNNQPFPNPIPDPNNPGEEKKVVAYQAFAPDRARVVGGANLAQGQSDFANAFVQRPDFLVKYAASLSAADFVDALLATIKNDLGADLTAQRQALVDLFNQAGGGTNGRGAVMYRLADDNAQGNPIINRALIDAEYNRAFVATQYFGYLRRDPDMGGFLFWLGQVSGAPLRDVPKQHAMVCSFITSTEYQQRFSSVLSHSNTECQ